MIDKWIEYLKVHPKYEGGEKIIDECKCEYEDDTCMNAVHVAVIRNKVQILKKLADADAGMDIDIITHTSNTLQSRTDYALQNKILLNL